MKAHPLPELEFLRECFTLSADSPSGIVWQTRPLHHFATERAWRRFNTIFSGKTAGSISVQRNRHTDYWRVSVGDTFIFVHRIVFALHHSSINIPEDIDHADGNGLNNCLDNLRHSSHGQNQMNRGKSKANSSGFKGVRLEGNGYRARIRKNGKLIHLGKFATPETAYAAYCKAGKEHQKEFFRKA